MAYAVIKDMKDRFDADELLQLTAADDTATDADDTVIQNALNDATEEINSYLGSVCEFPITPVPARLVLVCCDMARYRLYDSKPLEEVRTRYKDAISWLRDVSRGVATLGTGAKVTTGPVSRSRSKVFTDDTIKKASYGDSY